MSENEEEYDEEYTEDLSESLGYNADFDWDTLSNEEHDLHDSIIGMSADELKTLDLSKLNDLCRWAAAQAWADFDDDERFIDIVHGLLNSTSLHPALDYGEIAVEILNDLIINEELDAAREIIAKLPRLAPEDPTLPERFTAILDAVGGNTAIALERFQGVLDALEDDAYAFLAVAADMIFAGLETEALEVLEKAEELALTDKDEELLEQIRDAREYAQDQLKSRGE